MNEHERKLTEKKKAERKAEKGKPATERNPEAEKTGGKKHTITARKVGKFAWQQIKDTLLAAGIATYLMYVTPIATVSCVAIGAASFVAKKLINAGVRYGKKHMIKKRKKNEKPGKKKMLPKPVAAAITVAGAALPMMLIPNPIALVAAGVSGTALAKITGLLKRKKYSLSSCEDVDEEEAEKKL